MLRVLPGQASSCMAVAAAGASPHRTSARVHRGLDTVTRHHVRAQGMWCDGPAMGTMRATLDGKSPWVFRAPGAFVSCELPLYKGILAEMFTCYALPNEGLSAKMLPPGPLRRHRAQFDYCS